MLSWEKETFFLCFVRRTVEQQNNLGAPGCSLLKQQCKSCGSSSRGKYFWYHNENISFHFKVLQDTFLKYSISVFTIYQHFPVWHWPEMLLPIYEKYCPLNAPAFYCIVVWLHWPTHKQFWLSKQVQTVQECHLNLCTVVLHHHTSPAYEGVWVHTIQELFHCQWNEVMYSSS